MRNKNHYYEFLFNFASFVQFLILTLVLAKAICGVYLAGINLVVQLEHKQDALIDELQRERRFRRVSAHRLRLPATSALLG